MSYVLSSELADNFVVGASPHPSITLEQAFKGKPVDLISKVKKPLLFLPAQVHHNLKFSVMRIVFSFSNFFFRFWIFFLLWKTEWPWYLPRRRRVIRDFIDQSSNICHHRLSHCNTRMGIIIIWSGVAGCDNYYFTFFIPGSSRRYFQSCCAGRSWQGADEHTTIL